MVSWQEIQIQSLLTAESDVAFFAVLSGIANKLGFDYCAYGMRMPLPISQPKMIMLNNYSTAWQQRYAKENYRAADPTVAHGMRSTLPLIWSDAIGTQSRPFWEMPRRMACVSVGRNHAMMQGASVDC